MARVWSRRHGHRREERSLSFCLRGPRGRACIESALDDDAFRLAGATMTAWSSKPRGDEPPRLPCTE